MTDLAVLAAGFGAIPLASILLYSFRAWLDAHREVVWGGFAGVIAFLGLSHAMAFVLEGKPFLFAGNDSLGAASFLLLFVPLVSIPAAFVPGWAFDAMGLAGGSAATALSTFLAATEASLALMLLVRGFLPIASADRGSRWIVSVMIGFIGISVVHFLVE